MSKKIKKLSFIDPSGANLKEVKIFIDKVIIEKNAGSGVVPYLPLPELKKKVN